VKFALKKIDKTVIRETVYIGALVIIFSCLMQSVFLIMQKWDYTVLLGNLLSAFVGILNFFLLGLTIQKVITSDDKKYINRFSRISQTARLFLMGAVAILGATLDCFNLWATLIPLLFPRIAILLRPLFNKKMEQTAGGVIQGEARDITNEIENKEEAEKEAITENEEE
jgi:hypothetical protein